MIEIELPNGVIAEFPDGMPMPEIEAALQRSFPPQREMSAVTAKPVPTFEERWQGSKGAVAETWPYALDAVLAAAAPQLGIAKNAPALMRLGGKAVNLGSRAMAGGVGGLWGEAERQQLQGEQSPDALALSGAIGAGSELAAPVAGALAKPVAKIASQSTLAGRFVSEKIKKQALERVENFISKAAPEMDTESAAFFAGEYFLNKKVISKEMYEKYKPFVLKAAEESGGRLELKNTMEYIENLRNRIGDYHGWAGKDANRLGLNNEAIVRLGFTGQEADTLRSIIQTGSMDAKDVGDFISNIWSNKQGGGKKYEKFYESVKDEKAKFKNALLKDMDTIITDEVTKTTVGDMIRNADSIHGENANFFRTNRAAARLIEKYRKFPAAGELYKADPDLALQKIWETTPLEITNFKNQLMKIDGGEKAWAAIEFDYVRKMFESAIKRSEDLGDKRLMPFQLIETIEKEAPKLDIVDPGLRKRINSEIDHLTQIMGGFKELAGTAGGAMPLALHGANIGRLFATGDISGVSPMVLEGLGLASAYYVMSPKAQKLLGTAGKQALKIAGHEAVK